MADGAFFAGPPEVSPDQALSVLVPGHNLTTGESEFEEAFGTPSSLEEDLLRLAAAVFAVDRAVERQPREHANRTLRLVVAVANPERFLPAQSGLRRVLRLLSHDVWQLEFVRDTTRQPSTPTVLPAAATGTTLLFSGGIDSLGAALALLRDGDPFQLVSHRTANQANRRAQKSLLEGLCAHGFSGPHFPFRVTSRTPSGAATPASIEMSQRTRSFVFLTLGAICALRARHRRVLFMAENGQMAIHLSLTIARVGAFSTHTAHPEVLYRMRAILAQVLDVDLEISNPYLYSTKAEVVQTVLGGPDPALLFLSESCWMNARLPPDRSHCGQCIPCILRHIAIQEHQHDHTRYQTAIWEQDFLGLDPQMDGRRNLVELAEFVSAMGSLPDEAIRSRWPELYEADPFFDATRAIEMYRRFAAEARRVLGSYPTIARLMT